MNDTKAYHREPRLSASAMDRAFACETTFARAWEGFDLRVALGATEEKERADASSGTLIHEVLSAIPFFSQKYSIGIPRNIFAVVDEAAANLGIELEEPERWYVVKSISKRNAFVENALARAVDETGSFSQLEINLDNERMVHPQRPQFSGLADVMVSFRDGLGKTHALIVDYKSGAKGPKYPRPAENKQLLSLAVLAAANKAPLESVSVSLFDRENVNGSVLTARYRKEHLEIASQQLLAKIDKAENLRDLVSPYFRSAGGDGTVPPSVQQVLDESASVGDNCAFCTGNICCQKMLAQRSSVLRAMDDTPLRDKNGIEAMNTNEFADALRQAAWLAGRYAPYEKLLSDLKEVARPALQNGAQIGGAALKEGARTWNLVPSVSGAKEGDPDRLRDLSPSALYEELKPAVGDLSFEGFLAAACEVNSTALRSLLMDRLGVKKPDELDARLKAIFDGKAPLAMSRRQPSVQVDTTLVEEAVVAAS